MATRKSKLSAADDVDDLFEGIGDDVAPTKSATKKPASKSGKPAKSQTEEDDLLAELETLGAQQPISRPHTPRVPPAATSAPKASPIKRATADTPPPASTRSSEEKAPNPRKSGDSARSYHTSFTPSATSSEPQERETKAPVAESAAAPAAATSGGWWGGILATASAAVKTAEAAVKEIQQNEEAKRWAEQVKGNVGALRGLGTCILLPEE